MFDRCRSLYNVVDSSVGLVPVTFVDPVLDAITPEWNLLDPPGSKMVEEKCFKGPNAIYNAEKMKGLPCGVQVVGGKWEEERVIEIMKVVDAALGHRGFGPGEWTKRLEAAATTASI